MPGCRGKPISGQLWIDSWIDSVFLTQTGLYPHFRTKKAGRQVETCGGAPDEANQSSGIRNFQFKLFDHECHQGVPAVEAQVAGQCAQVVEKPFARQELADAPVVGVEQFQEGVEQEGQEIEGGQEGGEMFFAMAVVWVR